MQKAKVSEGFTLIAVPTELVEELELCSGDKLQYSISRGRLIIEPIDDEIHRICPGCCMRCPGRFHCENSCV